MSKSKKLFIAWLLVVLQTMLIFSFSMKPADISRQQSQAVVERLEPVLAGMESRFAGVRVDREQVHSAVRKGAHGFLYGMLAVFWCLALFYTGFLWAAAQKGAFWASVITGSMDELLQFYIPGRGGQWTDVLVDAAGALLGLMMLGLLKTYHEKKTKFSIGN